MGASRVCFGENKIYVLAKFRDFFRGLKVSLWISSLILCHMGFALLGLVQFSDFSDGPAAPLRPPYDDWGLE